MHLLMKKLKKHYISELSHWYKTKTSALCYFPTVTISFFSKDYIINIFWKILISILKCFTCLLHMNFIYNRCYLYFYPNLSLNILISFKILNYIDIHKHIVTLNNYILKYNMERTSERILAALIYRYTLCITNSVQCKLVW